MISNIYVEHLPYLWRISCIWYKTCEHPEDGQQLRLKHVGALINELKALCKKVGIKFYVYKCTVDHVNYSVESINSAVFSRYGIQADNFMSIWELLSCVATNGVWLDD